MRVSTNLTTQPIGGNLLRTFIAAGVFFAFVSCQAGIPYGREGQAALDQTDWNAMTKAYVSADGWVNYGAWKKDSVRLNKYLAAVSANPPAANAPRNEAMAYWINAYNAYTVKLILSKYPLASIKDLNPKVAIYKVNTVWQWSFFKIGGEDFNLDKIEHSILRAKFFDPRIHFALNCASVSCPILRNEAYTADKLEAQLTDQAKKFLSDPIRNKVVDGTAYMSKIFDWYGGDFSKNGLKADYLNKFAPQKLPADATWKYLDYDWRLNDIKNKPGK